MVEEGDPGSKYFGAVWAVVAREDCVFRWNNLVETLYFLHLCLSSTALWRLSLYVVDPSRTTTYRVDATMLVAVSSHVFGSM